MSNAEHKHRHIPKKALQCSIVAATLFALSIVALHRTRGSSEPTTINTRRKLISFDARPIESLPLSSIPATGRPKVAWLMSFPNSGTSFTQALVQDVTGTTVGSFYGHEFLTKDGKAAHNPQSIPVFDDKPDGPFRLSELPLPSSGFILSKTHCGGYCFSDCPPNWFILTPQKFLQECNNAARFTKKEDGSSAREWVKYDPAVIKKAIHLVRDPFDNVVSRFHHEFNSNKQGSAHIKWENEYENNPSGFRKWCEDSDKKYRGESRWVFNPTIFAALDGVPCHNEFFRYIQWHNNAFAVTTNLKIPVLPIHYREYSDDLSGTIDKILDFVELERNGAPAPPFNIKVYTEEYYTKDEKDKIITLLKYLATTDTLEQIERYL